MLVIDGLELRFVLCQNVSLLIGVAQCDRSRLEQQRDRAAGAGAGMLGRRPAQRSDGLDWTDHVLKELLDLAQAHVALLLVDVAQPQQLLVPA